jgi:hypothetical protein
VNSDAGGTPGSRVLNSPRLFELRS